MTLPSRDYPLTPTSDPSPIIYPLVHDELDVDNALPLTRTGPAGSGHYCTATGWSGNGVDSRLQNTSLPPWLAGAGSGVSMYAKIKLGTLRRTSRDYYVGLTTSGDSPKLELSAVTDTTDGNQTQVAFRYGGTLIAMNRSNWRFAFRLPELNGTTVPYNQALLFLDSSTLLLACHFADALTAIYQCDLSTGNWTGKATTTTQYQHIGSMGKDSTGQVWFNDTHGNNVPVDLATSFSTGTITAASRGLWSTPDVPTNGGITFAAISGTNYVMKINFTTTAPGYLYIFTESQMGATAMAADRVKRFDLGTYVQDITWRQSDGKLYVSRGISPGKIDVYDIAYALANTADSATLTPVASYKGPSTWMEGIDFHPVTDECWLSTEGLSTPGDVRQFSGAIWLSTLSGQPEENRYMIDYVPATGEYQIRINERLFAQFTVSIPTAPTRLVIGGPPNATAGWKTGYSYGGSLRTLAFNDRPFSSTQLADLVSDAHSSGTLTSTALTILNPGAELVGTGSPLPVLNWTDESAGTVTYARASNPVSSSGSYYFASTGPLQFATQQVDLVAALGISGTDLDTLTAAGKVSILLGWKQASWDGSSDPGGVGIRCLSSTGTTLSTVKSTEIYTDADQSFNPRTFSAQVASGTRAIKICLHATRTAGTNLDSYVDDVTASVVVQS